MSFLQGIAASMLQQCLTSSRLLPVCPLPCDATSAPRTIMEAPVIHAVLRHTFGRVVPGGTCRFRKLEPFIEFDERNNPWTTACSNPALQNRRNRHSLI